MTPLLAALRSAVYATGFVFLWGWIALGARRFDAALGGALPAALRPLGAVVMALGAVLALACVAVFVVRGRGTPAPFDPPRAFVAVGPYRWVRNPMYLGGLTVLLGLALWERSPAMLLVPPAVAVLAHLLVVLYEEPGLERRFGESYREYKRTVRRWLPRPRA